MRIEIILITAWLWFCGIRNSTKLWYAVIMRKAAKAGKLTEVSAVIIRQIGAGRGGYRRHIWAEYTLNDVQYTGKMICVPRLPVRTGGSYTAFVCRKLPAWFVTDIKQTFDAVLTYAVLAPLALLGAAVFTFFQILEYLQKMGVIR